VPGKASILFIIEQGGYPLFSSDLEACGFDVQSCTSMRKGLSYLKTSSPDLVLAEFNYGPRYGVLISNLEPLLSHIQLHHPNTRVIVFYDKEHGHHLDTLRQKYAIADTLPYPLDKDSVISSIKKVLGS
jgi:DNA-binding NtrC family response regulator